MTHQSKHQIHLLTSIIQMDSEEKRKMTGQRKKLIGTVEILSATIIWGAGYTVIKNTLSSLHVSFLLCSRYLLAALPFLFITRGKSIKTKIIEEGAVLGALLYLSQACQTFALAYKEISAGQVAFITALYIVIVPFMQAFIHRKLPKIHDFFSILLAIPGILLLTGTANLSLKPGTFLALAGSFGFSLHILAIDKFTEKQNSILLVTQQFLWAAIISCIIQIIKIDEFPMTAIGLPTLTALLYTGLAGTAIGFFMQFLGQKNLPPLVSSVLLSTEALFGMFFSVIFAGEKLAPKSLLGCIFLIAAILLSEL